MLMEEVNTEDRKELAVCRQAQATDNELFADKHRQ